MEDNYNQATEKFENVDYIVEKSCIKYPEFKDKIKKFVENNIKMISSQNNSSSSQRSTPSPYFSDNKQNNNILSVDKLTNSENSLNNGKLNVNEYLC